jgi:hypothetical protein
MRSVDLSLGCILGFDDFEDLWKNNEEKSLNLELLKRHRVIDLVMEWEPFDLSFLAIGTLLVLCVLDAVRTSLKPNPRGEYESSILVPIEGH